MIGLTGSHRTGKSTMAARYAEQVGIPYVTTPPGFKEAGVDPNNIRDMETRMLVQETRLHLAEEIYSELRGTFISDRTPLDMAAYTMADVTQHISPVMSDRVQAYINRCFDVTNRHFSCLVYVPIAIPYVVEEGKPAPNLAYQAHIGTLIKGFLFDPRSQRPSYTINVDNVNLVDRLETLEVIRSKTLHEIGAHRQFITLH